MFLPDTHDTVLHQAVYTSNEEIIRLVLNKIKEKFNQETQQIYRYINAKDTESDTPLMWAAEKAELMQQEYY
jgi:ankyrin repeat protein